MLAWLTANAATIIISLLLAAVVFLIIRGMVRGRVGGCADCGSCGSCSACRASASGCEACRGRK